MIGLGVMLSLILGAIVVVGIPLFTAGLMSLLLWQARRKKVIDARPVSKALLFALSLLGAIALASITVYAVLEFLPDNILADA